MEKLSYNTWYKIIFWLSVIEVSFQNSALTTNWNFLGSIIKIVIILMEAIYLVNKLQDQVYTETFIKILILLILAIYTGIQIKTYGYLNLILLLICSQKITDGEFINMFFKCFLFELLFCIFTWPLGILLGKEGIIYGELAYEIAEHRIAWGTIHPNIVAGIVSWLLITYVVIQYKKQNNLWPKLIWSVIIAIIFQLTTQSATFYYFYIFILGIFCLKKQFLNKVFVKVGKNIFWILGLFTYIVVKAYSGWGPSILQKISQILNILSTQRISMSSLALITNGITLFGQKTSFSNVLYNWNTMYNYQGFTIDMFYTYLGVSAGLIYFVLVSYGLFKLCRNKGSLFSLCVIIYSLYSLANVNLIFCTSTFVIFYMRDLIFKKQELISAHDFW